MELPIPFDGWGRMEVDLLCAPSRIAIELDGGQHFGDAMTPTGETVRKDALLQENDYLVLRFLAEDVGKYLRSEFWMRSCGRYPIKMPESPQSEDKERGSSHGSRGSDEDPGKMYSET